MQLSELQHCDSIAYWPIDKRPHRLYSTDNGWASLIHEEFVDDLMILILFP